MLFKIPWNRFVPHDNKTLAYKIVADANLALYVGLERKNVDSASWLSRHPCIIKLQENPTSSPVALRNWTWAGFNTGSPRLFQSANDTTCSSAPESMIIFSRLPDSFFFCFWTMNIEHGASRCRSPTAARKKQIKIKIHRVRRSPEKIWRHLTLSVAFVMHSPISWNNVVLLTTQNWRKNSRGCQRHTSWRSGKKESRTPQDSVVNDAWLEKYSRNGNVQHWQWWCYRLRAGGSDSRNVPQSMWFESNLEKVLFHATTDRPLSVVVKKYPRQSRSSFGLDTLLAVHRHQHPS